MVVRTEEEMAGGRAGGREGERSEGRRERRTEGGREGRRERNGCMLKRRDGVRDERDWAGIGVLPLCCHFL